MRILLSGTSNSIIAGGIRQVLANDPRVTHFVNLSYGASGTVAIGDHLQHIDFKDFDFCVLDYCVNEEGFIWLKESTVDAAINNISMIINEASKAGCQPIVVVFPILGKADFVQPTESKIGNYFQSLGIPVFDFYAFAKLLMEASGVTFKELFLDPMHVRRELGSFVGLSVLQYMLRVFASGPYQSKIVEATTVKPLSFVSWEKLNILGNNHVERRATKLLEAELLWVQPGAELSFSLSSEWEVVGVTFNAARSVGTLSNVNSKYPSIVIRNRGLFTLKRELVLVCRPLALPIKSHNGEFRISYQFVDDLETGQPVAGLEILGFILRSCERTEPLHILTAFDGETRLEEQVTSAEIAELAKMLVEVAAR